eukprot:TRINITY_DN10838_c0_g2_i3.p1 TRINITY_DN10838_c0_g2~~TRINITY_DN10838_c0_g2_i3.p1  ORF type:complete len:451 (-),score=58.47 TRINITY_DN10838_c0_g2_i3:94-1446(-)
MLQLFGQHVKDSLIRQNILKQLVSIHQRAFHLSVQQNQLEEGGKVDDAIQHEQDELLPIEKRPEDGDESSEEELKPDPGATGIPGSSWILTTDGARQVEDLVGVPFSTIVNGRAYQCKDGFEPRGNAYLRSVRTQKGFSLQASPQTQVMVRQSEVKVESVPLEDLHVKQEDYKQGSLIQLSDNSKLWIEDLVPKEFNYGWLMGHVIFNGFVNDEEDGLTSLRFPTKLRNQRPFQKKQARRAFQIIDDLLPTDFRFLAKTDYIHFSSLTRKSYKLNSDRLTELAKNFFDLEGEMKMLNKVEKESLSFSVGLLQGAHSSVAQLSLGQGGAFDGIYIERNGRVKLQCVQRMLARIGIISELQYVDKKDDRTVVQLRIRQSSIPRFQKVVGFGNIPRQWKLDYRLKQKKQLLKFWDFYTSEVTKSLTRKVAPVYECKIEGGGFCDVNGCLLKMG